MVGAAGICGYRQTLNQASLFQVSLEHIAALKFSVIFLPKNIAWF